MSVDFPMRLFKIHAPEHLCQVDYFVNLFELAQEVFMDAQDLENVTALNKDGSIQISGYTITRHE